MQAVEFETDVKNHRIQIPRHEGFKFRHVKVILIGEFEQFEGKIKPEKKRQLSDPFLKAKNFKFDRQQANAR